MEAGGDEEAADGQIQTCNANVCPSESRDDRSNGTCALLKKYTIFKYKFPIRDHFLDMCFF